MSPCNGFHDEFHILILFYDEYVTVFRRDQFRGVVQYFSMKQTFNERTNLREGGEPSENIFQPDSPVAKTSGSSQPLSFRLFNVLFWLWNIYQGAELPSVYFITNTKHCIAY